MKRKHDSNQKATLFDLARKSNSLDEYLDDLESADTSRIISDLAAEYLNLIYFAQAKQEILGEVIWFVFTHIIILVFLYFAVLSGEFP